MYGKIVDGELVLAPDTYESASGLIIYNFNLQEDLLKEFGYKKIIDKTIDNPNNYDLIVKYSQSDESILITYTVNNSEEYISDLKEKLINKTKYNLARYIDDNPLFSICKYEDGRYYTATVEKQNQLTSVLSVYLANAMPYVLISMSQGNTITDIHTFLLNMNNLPLKLYWNAQGELCEEWTYSEINKLKDEMTQYVMPMVSLQQTMEVELRELNTQEELKSYDIEFTKEKIDAFIESKVSDSK